MSAAAAVKAPSMTNVMSDIGASAQAEQQQVGVFVGVIGLIMLIYRSSPRVLFENVCCDEYIHRGALNTLDPWIVWG